MDLYVEGWFLSFLFCIKEFIKELKFPVFIVFVVAVLVLNLIHIN